MIRLNSKMKDIIGDNELDIKDIAIFDYVEKNIVKKLRNIHNCIIYDPEHEIIEENINFERILAMNGDWTGYEVSCNELTITECINQSKLKESIWSFRKSLQTCLHMKYPTVKFGIIISISQEDIFLRLHTYRQEEGGWLDWNLDAYETPIMYEIMEASK